MRLVFIHYFAIIILLLGRIIGSNPNSYTWIIFELLSYLSLLLYFYRKEVKVEKTPEKISSIPRNSSMITAVKKLAFDNMENSSEFEYERAAVEKIFEEPVTRHFSKHIIINKPVTSEIKRNGYTESKTFEIMKKETQKKNLIPNLLKTQETYEMAFEKLKENFEYLLNLGESQPSSTNQCISAKVSIQEGVKKIDLNPEQKKSYIIHKSVLPTIPENNESEMHSEFLPVLHKDMSFNPKINSNNNSDDFTPTPLGTKPFAMSSLEINLKQLNNEPFNIDSIPPQTILPVFKVKPFATQEPVLSNLPNPFTPVAHSSKSIEKNETNFNENLISTRLQKNEKQISEDKVNVLESSHLMQNSTIFETKIIPNMPKDHIQESLKVNPFQSNTELKTFNQNQLASPKISSDIGPGNPFEVRNRNSFNQTFNVDQSKNNGALSRNSSEQLSNHITNPHPMPFNPTSAISTSFNNFSNQSNEPLKNNQNSNSFFSNSTISNNNPFFVGNNIESKTLSNQLENSRSMNNFFSNPQSSNFPNYDIPASNLPPTSINHFASSSFQNSEQYTRLNPNLFSGSNFNAAPSTYQASIVSSLPQSNFTQYDNKCFPNSRHFSTNFGGGSLISQSPFSMKADRVILENQFESSNQIIPHNSFSSRPHTLNYSNTDSQLMPLNDLDPTKLENYISIKKSFDQHDLKRNIEEIIKIVFCITSIMTAQEDFEISQKIIEIIKKPNQRYPN